MKSKLKLFSLFIFSIFVFVAIYFLGKAFFQSQAMVQFIWNVNTFRGMFSHLPENLPKEHIIGSYAFAFKDYYAHLPRTVSQNADYYAFLIASLSAVHVFLLMKGGNRANQIQTVKRIFYYVAIVLLGLGIRLFFAYHTTGNHDMVSWYIDKDVLEHGENIFSVTDRYNYSPFWLLALKLLMKINHLLPRFSFMFIVRAFLTLIDLVTLWFVSRTAQLIGFSGLKAAALFFLNPVTIIISGYHGQFDNIAILFLFVAIYLVIRYGRKAAYVAWFLVTLGIVAKHEILQQSLILLRHMKRSNAKIAALFLSTVLLFLLCFLPYWREGSARILGNVFRYGGISRPYGFIFLDFNSAAAIIHKYLFIALLLLWPFCFGAKQLIKSSLIGMLLFLTFTSGISAQQFVLPIALAALQPSAGFYLFTITASLFLFGNIDELKMPFFEPIGWSCVWIAVSVWFILELKQKNTPAKFGFPEVF